MSKNEKTAVSFKIMNSIYNKLKWFARNKRFCSATSLIQQILFDFVETETSKGAFQELEKQEIKQMSIEEVKRELEKKN